MKNKISMGIGGTLIIVILMALCLTVFSSLSFTTAYSDLKLINRAQEIAADYYETEAIAQDKLSEVYNMIVAAENNGSKESFYVDLRNSLLKNEDISILHDSDDNFTVQYEALGCKNQKINVTLKIYMDDNVPKYEILTWNLSNIELPVYEVNELQLWEGAE